MLTYKEAAEMMGRARSGRRKLENNTWLEERTCDLCAGSKEHRLHVTGEHEYVPLYAVRLHDTDVVTLHPDGSYTLNSGGWRTVTTKDRINHYGNAPVGSNRGQWMVATKKRMEPAYYDGGEPYEVWDWGAAVPFVDGMRVFPGGRVEGAGVDETAIRNALLKQIRAYVDGFARYVAKHGLADPSGGDCWGCLMSPAGKETAGPAARGLWGQDKATKPGADHIMGVGHIFEHFKDRYYVPSLVWRAMQRRGNPEFCYRMVQADAKRGDTRVLRADLRAYFKALMPALVAAKVAESEMRGAA